GQHRPPEGGLQADALRGRYLLPLTDVQKPVLVPQLRGGGERLRRPGQIKQVQPRRKEEYDRAHDPVSSATVRTLANRPGSTYSVRAMMSVVCSVRGSARISASGRPGGTSRCSIGCVAVASIT